MLKWMILVLYLLLAIGYNLTIPIFEAPDENYHYFTAQYIAQAGRLPNSLTDSDMGQEAAQPPLYYLIAAGLIRLLPPTSPPELWLNPHARLGNASSPLNINQFIHPPNESQLPYAQTVRTVRLLSTLFGLATLLLVYQAARLLWTTPSPYPVLAMGIVAFCPQFIFHHAVVTNDSLIILLATAGIFQLLSLFYHPLTHHRALLLGLTIGCAILTKMAGLLLLGYALLFILWLSWRKTINPLPPLFIVGSTALLLAGWLLWRNFTLYGDPTAANQFIRLAGGDRHYTLWQAIAEAPSIWSSFFALFGWFNVRSPDWVQLVWTTLVLLSLFGYGIAISKLQFQNLFITVVDHPLFSISLWTLVVYAGILQFLLHTPAAQARLLFPAILPLALTVIAGWQHLPLSKWQWLPPFAALITATYSLFATLPTAYTRMEIGQMPPTATPYHTNLGQGITLLGVEWTTDQLQPGQSAQITLYWQTTAPILHPPEEVIILLGRNGQQIGKWQGYHGHGQYPANFWQIGQTMVETLPLPISLQANVPTQATAHIALVGQPISQEIGRIKIGNPLSFPPVETPLAQLGEEIQLVEANLRQEGSRLTADIVWHVLAPPNQDYTTFIHLGDPTQPPLAQGDAPPTDYPTHWWTTGERITDQYTLEMPASLPSGRYPIWLGMYQTDGTRLPLISQQIRQPHDAYLLGWIQLPNP